MIPVSWTNGDYDAEKYKSEVKPDCDWFFKGGIPLGSTKDSVDKALGKPYSEISDNNGNYNCGYCISDKFEPITQADYAKIQNGEKSDKPTYLGFAMFGENKLIAFAMAYGSVPEVLHNPAPNQ